MKAMAASEAKQAFGSLIDAVAREPVVIQKQKRDVAVVLSIDEYERLSRLNAAEFQRFCDAVGAKARDAGLTEAKLKRLLAA